MFVYCNNNPVVFVDSLGREPTESIDTDGDGEPDCYVYEYTYTYVVKYQMATVSWTVTGSVYIYTGRTTADMETIESPDGFDARTDILVADLTNNSNATMYAYQAQKVDSVYRMSIIKCLRQYDLDFNTNWDRSESSLLTEWNSHQVFAIFDKSAQDIDFDNDEEGWTFGDYCQKAFDRAKKRFSAVNREVIGLNKKDQMCRYFAHGYMFCSVVGIALLFPAYDIAVCLLGIGATSVYISFGVFLAASVNRFWGICAFLWSILFPVLLIVSYIFAIKKRYRMLLVTVVLDTLVSILFAVYTISTKNWYGFQQAIADVIVSFGVLFFFVSILRMSGAE